MKSPLRNGPTAKQRWSSIVLKKPRPSKPNTSSSCYQPACGSASSKVWSSSIAFAYGRLTSRMCVAPLSAPGHLLSRVTANCRSSNCTNAGCALCCARGRLCCSQSHTCVQSGLSKAFSEEVAAQHKGVRSKRSRRIACAGTSCGRWTPSPGSRARGTMGRQVLRFARNCTARSDRADAAHLLTESPKLTAREACTGLLEPSRRFRIGQIPRHSRIRRVECTDHARVAAPLHHRSRAPWTTRVSLRCASRHRCFQSAFAIL